MQFIVFTSCKPNLPITMIKSDNRTLSLQQAKATIFAAVHPLPSEIEAFGRFPNHVTTLSVYNAHNQAGKAKTFPSGNQRKLAKTAIPPNTITIGCTGKTNGFESSETNEN